jgi:hypothetical protein
LKKLVRDWVGWIRLDCSDQIVFVGLLLLYGLQSRVDVRAQTVYLVDVKDLVSKLRLCGRWSGNTY